MCRCTQRNTQKEIQTQAHAKRHTHVTIIVKEKEAENLRVRSAGGVGGWYLGGIRGRKGKKSFVILFKLKTYF